jgi:hypothetical protein
MLQELFDFINENNATISVIATAVIAAFAVISTILTALLAIENRRLRLAGLNPQVVAYLEPHPDAHGGVNFVLANIGQGPAFDVKFELDYDELDFRAHNAHLFNDPDRTSFTVLPQGDRRSFLFGVGYVLFGNDSEGAGKILKPFTVRTRYKNILGWAGSSSHKIDISQFIGLAGMTSKPASRDIADSLRKIEHHLGKISHQASDIFTMVDTTRINDAYKRKAKGNPAK